MCFNKLFGRFSFNFKTFNQKIKFFHVKNYSELFKWLISFTTDFFLLKTFFLCKLIRSNRVKMRISENVLFQNGEIRDHLSTSFDIFHWDHFIVENWNEIIVIYGSDFYYVYTLCDYAVNLIVGCTVHASFCTLS